MASTSRRPVVLGLVCSKPEFGCRIFQCPDLNLAIDKARDRIQAAQTQTNGDSSTIQQTASIKLHCFCGASWCNHICLPTYLDMRYSSHQQHIMQCYIKRYHFLWSALNDHRNQSPLSYSGHSTMFWYSILRRSAQGGTRMSLSCVPFFRDVGPALRSLMSWEHMGSMGSRVDKSCTICQITVSQTSQHT